MFDDTSYTLRFPRKAALLSVLVAAAVAVGYNTESAERRRHKQQQNSNGGRRGGGNRGSGRHGHCFASENQTSREIVLTL